MTHREYAVNMTETFPAAPAADRGKRAGARERILASARDLFRAQGINATGIDAIVAGAGAAKGSVYYNFDGKTAIVAAYLETELARWREAAADADSQSARADVRVGAFFDALARSIEDRTFVGCPFTNAVVEQPDCAPVREIARRYRQELHEHVGRLLGRSASDDLVVRIVILYEGAIMGAKISADAVPVLRARELAHDLVRGA